MLGNALTSQTYGSVSGANASPAIQAQVNAEGRFVLPPGDFKIQDPIVFPESANGGWSYGAGQEKSRLIADGLDGTSVIKVGQTHLVRLAMSDFGIVGNGTVVNGITTACDHALDLSVGAGFYLNRGHFQRLNLKSNDDAFYAPREFSTLLERVDAHSVSGHCFYLGGSVATQLNNCYAGRVGASKAGFRILTGSTLIACNGVDEQTNDCYWGWFGDDGSVKGVYRIGLIGCNAEDFGSVGLRLDYSGWIKLEGVTTYPRATGTYRCVILAANGAEHFFQIDLGTMNVSKGATHTGESLIISDAGTMFGDVEYISDSERWPNYYRTTQTALVDNLTRSLRTGE